MPPAQIDAGQRARPFDQELLDVILLQVDERRAAVPRLGQQVELVDLRVAEEHATDAPAHALLHQGLGAAQPVENLQRALRPADRPRADADGVVLVEHQHVDAAQREIDRRGQPHRSRAGNDHRPVLRRAGDLGGLGVGVHRLGVGFHRGWPTPGPALSLPMRPTTPGRVPRSRYAGRDAAWPRHRRATRRRAGSDRR